MKKIISLALSIMLLVSCFAFASCGKEPTPYELISSAVEKSAALTDVEMEQTVNMKMDMSGISMDIPITMTLKGKDINTDNAVYYSLVKTEMMGMSVDAVIYVEGDDIYTVTMGEGFKVTGSDMLEEYDISKDISAVFYSPAESTFEGVEIVKNEDGTSSVSLALTQDEYMNAYRPYYDSLMGEVGLGSDSTLSDIKITVTVSTDGYICGFKMSCGLSMTVTEMGMNIPVTATLDTDIKFVNIGKDVVITPPEGYQSFPALGLDEK